MGPRATLSLARGSEDRPGPGHEPGRSAGAAGEAFLPLPPARRTCLTPQHTRLQGWWALTAFAQSPNFWLCLPPFLGGLETEQKKEAVRRILSPGLGRTPAPLVQDAWSRGDEKRKGRVWGRDLLTAVPSSPAPSTQRPVPSAPPPHPWRLTLVTVAPSEARAALPLQRRHRPVGHSVRGPDQGPVTDTRAASGQCEPPPAPPQTPLLPSQPSRWVLWPQLCATTCVALGKGPCLSVPSVFENPFQLCLPESPQVWPPVVGTRPAH